MKKRLIIGMMVLLASLAMQAQYVVNSHYDLWFEGTDSEMTTRKIVWANEDYQDFWNGTYVRFQNNKVYIKDGSSTVLYGDEVGLIYNGCYFVKNNNLWYLYDSDGDKVGGVYGSDIYYYPFNYIACKKNANLYYIYRANGQKLDFYSEELPSICSNECWIVKQGSKWYGIDRDGYKISGVYGDRVSLNNGRWKCVNNGYVRFVDVE